MSTTKSSATITHEDIAGLDIGDSYVAVSRVKLGRAHTLDVRHAGCVELGANASEREYVAAIRRLWSECHIPTHTVCASLHSHALTYKYFSFPGGMTAHEIDAALHHEAEDTLQLPLDKIALDWRVHKKDEKDDHNDLTEGILIAAPSKDIQDLRSLLQKAGLYPVIIDLGCMAICNLFLHLHDEELNGDPVCIAHVDSQRADIAFLHERRLVYSRRVRARSSGNNGGGEYLISSISDQLRYCRFKLRHEPAKRIYLTGSLDDHASFSSRLSEETELPVTFWNPLSDDRVKLSRHARRLQDAGDHRALMTVSLGLALRRG